jgi:hypothetical protein
VAIIVELNCRVGWIWRFCEFYEIFVCHHLAAALLFGYVPEFMKYRVCTFCVQSFVFDE